MIRRIGSLMIVSLRPSSRRGKGSGPGRNPEAHPGTVTASVPVTCPPLPKNAPRRAQVDGCPYLGVVAAGDTRPLYALTHGTLADSSVSAASDTVTLSMGRSCNPFPRVSTLSTALSLDASAILHSAGGSFVLRPANIMCVTPSRDTTILGWHNGR